MVFKKEEIGDSVLYLGDCLEVMPTLESESVDLVITDPPYNISNYKNSLTKVKDKIVRADFGEWDKWDDIEEYFSWCLVWVKELERIIKKGGSIYTFFDNHYADHLTYLIEKNTNLRQKCPIVLIKNNPIPRVHKNNFRSTFERCTLFVKDKDKKPKTFNFQKQSEMTNAIRYNIGQKETEHPTEKPLSIIELFVKVSSNQNDIVFDCFMGSGTTGVASLKLGRKFIGVEIDEDYYNIAKKRILKWTAQGRLNDYC